MTDDPMYIPRPFYHPHKGWMYGSERICDFAARHLCKDFGIPYCMDGEDLPDDWQYLLTVEVAGTDYVDGVGELIGSLDGDSVLYLKREDNPHDPNAIVVTTDSEAKLGYVPRKDNAVLSKMMDAGDILACSIASLDKDSCSLSIHIFLLRGKVARRHFSTYSDPLCGSWVEIDVEPVTRESFEFKFISDNVRSVDFRYELTSEALWNLGWGHMSRSMDDRWHFFTEYNQIYFCRSWTGCCIFELTLGRDGIHKLLIEGNPNVCSITDDEAVKTVKAILDGALSPVMLPDCAFLSRMIGNFETYKTDSGLRMEVQEDGIIRLSLI